MNTKKFNWKNIFYYGFWVLICVGIIGASTYPFISDYMLAQKQQAQVEKFNKSDDKSTKKDYLDAFYQKQKTQKVVNDPFKGEKKSNSKNSTDVAKDSLNTIGVLSVPKIKEVLPIFDNTSSVALDNGVGLLEHTSDLTGGKGKHAVLTGHSGLSLNKLFTDLPKLKKGDQFYVKANGKVHAYKVDQIKTVLPDDMSALQVDPNQDFVTLVTCTPLFVNTHRLLVRGHRVPYDPNAKIKTDGGLTSLGKAVLVGLLVLTIMLTVAYLLRRRQKKLQQLKDNNSDNLDDQVEKPQVTEIQNQPKVEEEPLAETKQVFKQAWKERK